MKVKYYTKQNAKQFLLIAVLFITANSFAQQNTKNNYTNTFIEYSIREVFNNSADDLVLNSNSSRLALITNFYNNLLSVEYRPELREKEFESTNDLNLLNKYNPSLQRDTNYNASTFNPLKYDIQISPLHKKMYRIANTDYLIIIVPNK